MNNPYWPSLTLLLICAVTVTLGAEAPGAWKVRIEGETQCDNCPYGKSFSFVAEGRQLIRFSIAEVSDIETVKMFDSKVIIVGHTGREGKIVTVYDLESKEQIETFIAADVWLSPGGRYAAFTGFYSWHDQRYQINDVLLLYDFAQPPAKNRTGQKRDHFSAGVPIFPRRNKKELRVSPYAGSNYTVSNIAWSDSGNNIGFVAEPVAGDARREKNYRSERIIVGLAAVSGGLEKSAVYLKNISIKELLRPEYTKVAKIRFFADGISVKDDGTLAVRMKTMSRLKSEYSINLIKEHDEQY